jgi:DNA-directed RNA polymerase subunit RPC12/RpoP
MDFHCASCGILVAEILHRSNIRKGAVMVCKNCFYRYKVADDMAKLAQDQTKHDLPPEFEALFGKK